MTEFFNGISELIANIEKVVFEIFTLVDKILKKVDEYNTDAEAAE